MKGIAKQVLPLSRFAVLLVGLLLAGTLCVSAQSRTATVKVKDVTIKELLKEIEKGSSFTFAYVDSDIDPSKLVSVNATDEKIETILASALPEMNVEFKGNKIILSRKAQAGKDDTGSKSTARKVKGRVLGDDGEPLVGAMVIEKGTSNGTATDIDGNYSLSVRGDVTLEASLLGYATISVPVSGTQTTANFTLSEDALMLDDVVVIGYGVQNRRDVTTAVSSIKAEDFRDAATTDFRQSMAAKMPGVQVLNLGGQPDGNVTVRVRGIQSATAGNDPLYVIDGIPCDSRAFANLEGSDIESLEVLKDASAAAIYGSRGSCGVVIVTTKRGSGEEPVISYDGQVSVSQVSKKIDMLDAYEFAQLFVDARNGAYLYNNPEGSIGDPSPSRPETYHRIDPIISAYLEDKTGTLTNTDWQDAIFRNALSHKHSLSVTAKKKDFNYYIGANYLYREGTVVGSDFRRYGLRANFDGRKGRVKYGVSFSPILFQDQLCGYRLPVRQRRCDCVRPDVSANLPGLQLRRKL